MAGRSNSSSVSWQQDLGKSFTLAWVKHLYGRRESDQVLISLVSD